MSAGSLLLLNGPPGIGKSTVARLLIRSRPLALCLDMDLLRRSLGQWTEHPAESGALARDLAVAAAAQHLRGAHAVVVPQFLGQLPFVERLERLAAEADATFVHVVLMDEKQAATSRFLARGASRHATEQHREADVMAGGAEGFGAMYDALLNVVMARPEITVVESAHGDIEGTAAQVEAALSGRW